MRRRSPSGAVSVVRPKKKGQRLNAHLAFLDESGFLLIPTLRRTWAPRGQTPLLRHRYQHDKISAISAVTVSPRRQRLGLYLHCHPGNIRQTQVAVFLRFLLRPLRGSIVLLWDAGPIPKGEEVDQVLERYPRRHGEFFPSYAPELNPDQWVWGHLKGQLANGRPDNVDELMRVLCRTTRAAQKRPQLLRSFITGCKLPLFLVLNVYYLCTAQ